jgi:BirA family biotin operon repressor/biotin-[acetyl-CoA-carboxylase] ligase
MLRQPDEMPREFQDALVEARDRLGPLGSPLLFFTTVESTNDIAMSLVSTSGCEGAVVVADRQTEGRGRRGHRWFSPPGTGLYVSVVLSPGRARGDAERACALTTLAAGVALAEGVQASTGFAPAIKWPNDLVVGRRKVAGILAEAVSGEVADRVASVVLGYGINVAAAAFPPELGGRATSLEGELGRPIDRAGVLAETLAALARRYDDLLEGRFDAILDAWRRRAPASRGARVTWEGPDGPCSGITDGIDDWGALLVKAGSKVQRVLAGELTWSHC